MTTLIGAVYAVIVRRVVDGNRLDVCCCYNPHRRCTQRVRLAGLRAPKAGTERGDQATTYIRAWLTEHAPATPPAVWVTLRGTRPAGFARYPAIIHAPDGACLNRDLLTSGHARPT